MKKMIGVGGSILFDEGGMFPGYPRAYVNDDYIAAVEAAEAIPLILPVTEDAEAVREMVSRVDGVILSGGYDVNPVLFDEEPHKLLGMTLDRRDTFDRLLIEEAQRQAKPILGICRGLQILNVCFGGTLYQDCSLAENSYVKHWQGNQPAQRTHKINIVENSILHSIFGSQTRVNSFHHMAVHEVAPGFKVMARAEDGIIEAIEKEDGSFVLGVQFHPEMTHREADMLKIFQLFVSRT